MELAGTHPALRLGAKAETHQWQADKKEPLGAAFFWLTAFCFFYCARPEDIFTPLQEIPIAKISVALAVISLLFSSQKLPRSVKDLPKESWYLFLFIILLFVSAFLSPVWKGGAVSIVLDFAKVCIAWVLMFFLITSFRRLRKIIFLQAASVAAICALALIKGHDVPRLNNVIGAAVYSNPNDLAFAIVLSIPLCLAFLMSTPSKIRKIAWGCALLLMGLTLMLTASRAGFIDLLVSGAFCLWYFSIRGKRLYLIVGTLIVSVILFLFAGQNLRVRLAGFFSGGESDESGLQDSAYESYEERRLLMDKAMDAIEEHPILGVGAGNFVIYSGLWKDVHATYLQIAADGGIPVLILFLMIQYRGFSNLTAFSRIPNQSKESVLFTAALKSSLIGFVVGACFAPLAFQFFPYFTVCYTSVLMAFAKEQKSVVVDSLEIIPQSYRFAKAWLA